MFLSCAQSAEVSTAEVLKESSSAHALCKIISNDKRSIENNIQINWLSFILNIIVYGRSGRRLQSLEFLIYNLVVKGELLWIISQ